MFEDLIGRLANAAAPNADLDRRIAFEVLGAKVKTFDPGDGDVPAWLELPNGERLTNWGYTFSIDNALTLVPIHWRVERAAQGPRGEAWLWVLAPIPINAGHYGKAHDRSDEVRGFSRSYAAIALCIAALKARSFYNARQESQET